MSALTPAEEAEILAEADAEVAKGGYWYNAEYDERVTGPRPTPPRRATAKSDHQLAVEAWARRM